jgi:HEPN domain-containing protein
MEFRKVHDLLLLLQICTSRDPSAAELREPCDFLNVFYVETRYPVHWPTQYTRKEAERACEAADRVKHWLELQIPIHLEP